MVDRSWGTHAFVLAAALAGAGAAAAALATGSAQAPDAAVALDAADSGPASDPGSPDAAQAAVDAGVLEPPEAAATSAQSPSAVPGQDTTTLHASEVLNATLRAPVAQQSRPGTTYLAGLFIGAQSWELSELNATLATNGYEPVSDVVAPFGFMLGAGGRHLNGAVLLSVAVIDIGKGGFDGRVTQLALLGQVGWYVYRGRRLALTPLLGAGYGGAGVDSKTQDPDRIPILRGQVRELSDPFDASTSMLLLELGFGAQFVIPVFGPRDYGLGVMLQAGYAFAPLQSNWTLYPSGSRYPGPPAEMAGPFVRLTLGGGADHETPRTKLAPVPSCSGETCQVQCDRGFASCDGDRHNGCEVDLEVDRSNCGACGRACPEAAFCSAGGCVTPQHRFR